MNAVWPKPPIAKALQHNILSLIQCVQHIQDQLPFKRQTHSGHTAWLGKQPFNAAPQAVAANYLPSPIINLNTAPTYLQQVAAKKPEQKNWQKEAIVAALQNNFSQNSNEAMPAQNIVNTAQHRHDVANTLTANAALQVALLHQNKLHNTNSGTISDSYYNASFNKVLNPLHTVVNKNDLTKYKPAMKHFAATNMQQKTTTQVPSIHLFPSESAKAHKNETAPASTHKKIEVHIARFTDSINLHVQQLPKAMEMTEDKIKQMFISAISSAQTDLY